MVGGTFGSIGWYRCSVSGQWFVERVYSGVGKWMDGDGDCCLVLACRSLGAGDEGALHQRA